MSNHNPLKSFWYLIATQFQGAFSDMAYKQLLSLVALSSAGSTGLIWDLLRKTRAMMLDLWRFLSFVPLPESPE